MEKGIKGLIKKIVALVSNGSRNPKFNVFMESAFSKIDTGRFMSARDEMLLAIENCENPLDKVFAAYNLGALYWAQIGNGKKAKEFYTLTVNEAEKRSLWTAKTGQKFGTKSVRYCFWILGSN